MTTQAHRVSPGRILPMPDVFSIQERVIGNMVLRMQWCEEGDRLNTEWENELEILRQAPPQHIEGAYQDARRLQKAAKAYYEHRKCCFTCRTTTRGKGKQ